MIEINNMELSLVEKRKEKLVKYLRNTLLVLPCSIMMLDNSKVLLAYFAVAGLDVLNNLDRLPYTKQKMIDWIYLHQINEITSSIQFFKIISHLFIFK